MKYHILTILISILSSSYSGFTIQIDNKKIDLSEAEKIILENHPLIASAKSEIAMAEAKKYMLSAPFLPMLSINGYAFEGKGSMIFPSTVNPVNYAIAPDKGSISGNITLMWKLFSGGRENTTANLARTLLSISEYELQETQQELLLRVRTAFAEAAGKYAKWQSSANALQATLELEKITKLMFEEGKIPEAFVLRAQAETAKAKKNEALSKSEYLIAMASLKESMGLQQTIEITIGEWDHNFNAPEKKESAMDLAVQTRPEARKLKQLQEYANLNTRLSSQSQLPELSLMAMADWMKTRNMSSENLYKAGLVLSFPLLDGGMRQSQIRENKAFEESLRLQVEALKLQIQNEVVSAWYEWEIADSLIGSAEAEVKAAEEAYRISLLRYEEGKTIQVEVTQALADLTQARASINEAYTYKKTAWSKLMRAMGISHYQENNNNPKEVTQK